MVDTVWDGGGGRWLTPYEIAGGWGEGRWLTQYGIAGEVSG